MACTSSAGCVPAFARRASLNRLDRRAVGSAVSKSLFFSAPIRFRGANHAAVSSPAVNAAATDGAPKKKVLVPVADGTEEIEAVTVIDVLRRAGAEVVVCSVEEEGRLEVVCSRGVKLVADVNVKDVSGRNAPNDWDLIAVPGGMPGAERIADHIKFDAVLKKHFMAGKLMAAICAAPAICFEPKGFLEGYAATAHPAFVDELGGSLQEKNIYAEARVVVDREVVTSRGPGTALEWALCLVERLYGTEHCKKIAGPMVVQPANARIRNQLEWRLDEAPLQEE